MIKVADNLYVSNIVKYILESNKFFKDYENKEKLEKLISEKKEDLKEVFKTFEDFKNNVSREHLGKFVNLRGLENFISKLSVKDAYSANIAKYILECNAFLKSHENQEDLEELIFAKKNDLKKVFKTSKDFKNKVSKERLKKLVNLGGLESFISKLSVKDAYSSNIAKYIFENNRFLKSHENAEDLEELIFKKKNDLKKVFKTSEDFKNGVSKEHLEKLVNLRGLESFISKPSEMKKALRPRMPLPNEEKIPEAPMRMDVFKEASTDDRKYATAIAAVIINNNPSLKQYLKTVPEEKVNFEKNRKQIEYAVLTCKNLKLLKETYKNSYEFLMNAGIDIFDNNETPKDVTKSLNTIINILKKQRRPSNLSSIEKTYLEDARKFIEMKSQFPNRVRNLNDICRFVEKNIEVLSKTYPKFKEIQNDKIYKFLKDSSLSTFEKFQQKFIDVFEIAYNKKLKPVKINAFKRY